MVWAFDSAYHAELLITAPVPDVGADVIDGTAVTHQDVSFVWTGLLATRSSTAIAPPDRCLWTIPHL